MKLQDKHKQFTVKYDVRSLVHGVSIPFFIQKALHTLLVATVIHFPHKCVMSRPVGRSYNLSSGRSTVEIP